MFFQSKIPSLENPDMSYLVDLETHFKSLNKLQLIPVFNSWPPCCQYSSVDLHCPMLLSPKRLLEGKASAYFTFLLLSYITTSRFTAGVNCWGSVKLTPKSSHKCKHMALYISSVLTYTYLYTAHRNHDPSTE